MVSKKRKDPIKKLGKLIQSQGRAAERELAPVIRATIEQDDLLVGVRKVHAALIVKILTDVSYVDTLDPEFREAVGEFARFLRKELKGRGVNGI